MSIFLAVAAAITMLATQAGQASAQQGAAPQAGQQQGAPADWRADWELADGLTMDVDTEGFRLPSQIVFVPEPGSGPKDPLYFVVELKGTVKVVTNDRSVHTFASDFMPNPQGQAFVPTGSAGLCLDPANGYVFTTFAYLDNTAIYRNGMVRFKSTPGSFGLKAGTQDLFLELFAKEESATSHQIGPCQVKDGAVYVTVGYAEDRAAGQNLHNTLATVIRMSLDFKPLPDNPFYEDERQDKAINYIWAYGFRNPFGLKFVGDRLFMTENGGSVDRFNEIIKGENYMWDGSDLSMASRAAQIFTRSVGIVHLDYIAPDDRNFPDDFRDRFVAAASGVPGAKGPGSRGARSVMMWQYDFGKSRMATVPREILRYRGKGTQMPVSAAVGPDGLYFAALLPNSAGSTPVYRIGHDPAADYPHRLGASRSAEAMLNDYGCRQCHKIEGVGGTQGPALDTTLVPRLAAKLNHPDYAKQVAEIDKLTSEPYAGLRKARAHILEASGEGRVKRWLPVYIRQPKFDNPKVEMPAVGVTEADAKAIADFLIRRTTQAQEAHGLFDRLRFALARLMPDLRYRHLFVTFGLGILVTLIAGALALAIARRRRR